MSYKDIDIKRIRRRIKGSAEVEVSNMDMDTSRFTDEQPENQKLLYECYRHWESLRDFRRRYMKNSDYNRGRQLDSVVRDKKGRLKTQRQIVREQGKTPIIVNVVRETVRTILGQYHQNPTRSAVYARAEDDKAASEMLTLALHSALDHNEFRELDAQQVEIFLLGGGACSRITNKFFDDVVEKDAYIENLNPNMLFFNGNIKDVRLDDLYIIGEIIETTVDNVINTYAKTYKQAMELEYVLKAVSKEYTGNTAGLSADVYKSDFFIPSEPSNIRIYPVWQKKQEFRVKKKDPIDGSRSVEKGDYKEIIRKIGDENEERKAFFLSQGLSEKEALATLIQVEVINYNYWEYRILTRDGYCLKKGESPYGHKSHPYVLSLYPLINGEVWGVVEDLIDLQDVINQNFMMFKWMVEASAKGLLIVPDEAIPEGMDIDDFAEEWSNPGGTIKLRALKKGAVAGSNFPQEINGVSNQNVKELLNFAVQMMDKVSGVHGALRGEEPKSGTPSSLYLQMAQNSAVSILASLKRFESYVKARDTKVLKNIMDIYETGRYIDLSGEGVIEEAMRWDKDKVKDVPFKLVVSSGVDNPVYRFMVEEQLTKLFDAGAIDIKTYLKKSVHPFSKEVLAEIEKQESQLVDESGELRVEN